MKFLFILFILISTANAATSATLLLKGHVPQILEISIIPETLATTLPLNTTQLNTKIAEVTEKSNSSTGYKVSIASQNSGKLVRNGGTEFVTYNITYDNVTVDLVLGDEFVQSSNTPANITKDVKISYTGVPHDTLIAGNYKDTVTFTIVAN